jgi:hypothetical protein
VPTDELRFQEIEHKFIVDERFDAERFRREVTALGPTRTGTIRVTDRYYLTEGGRARRFLLRHRYDAELHQLTIKAVEADTEVRGEVNLDLDHHGGSQDAQVDAFVERLGVQWRGTLQKDLEVWYFSDCEVVYYQASTPTQRICCVEFEAIRKDSLDEALAILDTFEAATGFKGTPRSYMSLPQLLFPELREQLARNKTP